MRGGEQVHEDDFVRCRVMTPGGEFTGVVIEDVPVNGLHYIIPRYWRKITTYPILGEEGVVDHAPQQMDKYLKALIRHDDGTWEMILVTDGYIP